jgi:hypothetical protein
MAQGNVTTGRLALGVALGAPAATLAAAVVLGLGLGLNGLIDGLVAFLESLPRLFIVIVLILTLASVLLPFATMLVMYITVGAIAAPVVRRFAVAAGSEEERRVRRAAGVATVCAVPLVFAVEQLVQPHLEATNYMSRMLLGAFGQGVPGLGGAWSIATWVNLAVALGIAVWLLRMPEAARGGDAGDAEAKLPDAGAPRTPMTSEELWKALERGKIDGPR